MTAINSSTLVFLLNTFAQFQLHAMQVCWKIPMILWRANQWNKTIFQGYKNAAIFGSWL